MTIQLPSLIRLTDADMDTVYQSYLDSRPASPNSSMSADDQSDRTTDERTKKKVASDKRLRNDHAQALKFLEGLNRKCGFVGKSQTKSNNRACDLQYEKGSNLSADVVFLHLFWKRLINEPFTAAEQHVFDKAQLAATCLHRSRRSGLDDQEVVRN